MKKLFVFLFFLCSLAGAQTFPVNNLQVNGTSLFTGTVSGSGIDTYTIQAGGPVNVKLYGAKCDGSTNDSVAINAALAASPNILFTGTCVVNAQLSVPSNRTITLAGGAVVTMPTANTNVFNVGGSSNVAFYGPGKIQNTSASNTNGSFALITANTSSHIKIYGVEFQGGPWTAVLFDACNDCALVKSYVHDALNTTQDSSCIYVTDNSTNIVIDGNTMTNCGNVGISILGAVSLWPTNLAITNNHISSLAYYGILIYQSGTTVVNYNARIANNTVTNVDGGITFTGSISGTVLTVTTMPAGYAAITAMLVKGSGVTTNTLTTTNITGNGGPGTQFNLSQSSAATGVITLTAYTAKGAGIYVVGVGGVVLDGNQVSYVAQRSGSNTLTPAGIAISTLSAGEIPAVISNNQIFNVGYTPAMSPNIQPITLSGINISSSPVGALLSGNSIVEQTGMTIASFDGIYNNASSNVVINGTTMNIANTLPSSVGVFVYAGGSNQSNISINNLQVIGTANSGLRADQSGGFTTSNLSISNYTFTGGATTASGMQLNALNGTTINGANVSATTQSAAFISAALNTRVSNSNLLSTGNPAVNISGTCTGSLMDESVNWGAAGNAMSNAGTGFNVRWRSNAMPTAGSWVIGDRTGQSVFSTGVTLGWDRITTGSGNVLGTDWKAEAVL